MNDTEIARICGEFEVPAIPALLQEILRVTSDPQSSYAVLESYISREPGVVMQLLKTANAACYGPRGQIDSVSRALVLLGVSVVTSLVSGLMLMDAFRRLPNLDRAYLRTIWRHALARSRLVSIFSERLAPGLRDSRFVAALLQDVGHLVLAKHYGQRYRVLLDRSPFPAVADEIRALGVDHATAGAYMLRGWHFPRSIIDLVENHHGPATADSLDIAYLMAADELIHAVDRQPRLLDEAAEVADTALIRRLEAVGWDWAALQAARDRIQDSFDLARRATIAGS